MLSWCWTEGCQCSCGHITSSRSALPSALPWRTRCYSCFRWKTLFMHWRRLNPFLKVGQGGNLLNVIPRGTEFLDPRLGLCWVKRPSSVHISHARSLSSRTCRWRVVEPWPPGGRRQRLPALARRALRDHTRWCRQHALPAADEAVHEGGRLLSQACSSLSSNADVLVMTVWSESGSRLLNSKEHLMVNTGLAKQRCDQGPSQEVWLRLTLPPASRWARPGHLCNQSAWWVHAIAPEKLMFREVIEYIQSHSGKERRHSTGDLRAAWARGQCFVLVCLPPEQRLTQWTAFTPSSQDFLCEASWHHSSRCSA